MILLLLRTYTSICQVLLWALSCCGHDRVGIRRKTSLLFLLTDHASTSVTAFYPGFERGPYSETRDVTYHIVHLLVPEYMLQNLLSRCIIIGHQCVDQPNSWSSVVSFLIGLIPDTNPISFTCVGPTVQLAAPDLPVPPLCSTTATDGAALAFFTGRPIKNRQACGREDGF